MKGLDKGVACTDVLAYRSPSLRCCGESWCLHYALVAQLDRALDYESRGREFESSRARHLLKFVVSSVFGVGHFFKKGEDTD